MSKAFILRFVFFLFGLIFFLQACLKDKGPLPKPPFNLTSIEGFESSYNLPSGWTLWNPDNDAAWQVATTVSNTGNNSVGFNNCSGDSTFDMTGRKDRLISPAYDFSKATNASISFNVAYAVLSVLSVTYTDTLAIYASIDNGATWKQIYRFGGYDLTNIPAITITQPCWAPSSYSDWRTDKIAVNSLAGHSKVKFAFENTSNWGEWIYIDNITINANNNTTTSCAGVTYAKTIQPIMQTQCAISGCHIAGGSGPTDFTSYTGVKADADNGTLKKRMINGNPSFMPASGKLPESTLSEIQCWLDAGAPNN